MKEGVVGRYVKKDTPPEMPSKWCNNPKLVLTVPVTVINVWTTEPKRRSSNQSRSSLPPQSAANTQTVQKFGNQKTTISDVGLGAHEGKYTPSPSVPDLATR